MMTIPLEEIEEMSIHLWCVPLDRFSMDRPNFTQYLSLEEKKRAARFRCEINRKRYEVSHGAIRVILGSYLRREPQSVRFELSETGKPGLLGAPGEPMISFNISHSGDNLALGVTKNRRIGVDVEMISHSIDIFQIAATYFTAAEAAEIQATPAGKQAEVFFSLWTCKEAYLKAVGCGLAGGLSSCSPNGRFRNWALNDGKIVQSSFLNQWALFSFKPSDGYMAAVAVDGQPLDFVQVKANQTCNSSTVFRYFDGAHSADALLAA